VSRLALIVLAIVVSQVYVRWLVRSARRRYECITQVEDAKLAKIREEHRQGLNANLLAYRAEIEAISLGARAEIAASAARTSERLRALRPDTLTEVLESWRKRAN